MLLGGRGGHDADGVWVDFGRSHLTLGLAQLDAEGWKGVFDLHYGELGWWCRWKYT